ncbi:hypothetical protein IMCC3135_31605 [Granulosicoccus antarcticus IMCC3135]|uniref:CBS domain-containing protein n=2 Tax=Granulosicoccus TaxID=437504 RepID=A0A2Z2P269_9GAMM|nr:hypothetical protein IMCC3135_31605 [Granulosicoccus antarcticus IMCC3135]
MQLSTFHRLQHVTPFDNLPDASLTELCSSAILHSIAAGDRIIEGDTMNPAYPVFIILSGRVRLVESEQQMTVRHLRANEVFGHFAMLRKLPPPYRAEISRAAVILEIKHTALLTLFARHPVFAAWFQADLRRFERELGAFDDVAGSRFLFGQRLVELANGPVMVCSPTLPIRDVARLMAKHDSDCVVINSDQGPVGLVSDSDLRTQVVAAGLSSELPVSTIMKPDPLTIRARASVFDGMMAMEDRNWRHLVLLDDNGALQGVVSDTDLARVLLNSPTALRRRVEQADNGQELRKLRSAADQMIVTLYRRGVRAEDLLQINTRFNDAMTVRILDIVSAQLDAPPSGLTWCWLSLGSEGRGEMGLRTDQDNAIIYDSDAPEQANTWLARLAEAANDMLDVAGIARCEAGIMASNSAMRHDLNGWSHIIKEWMSDTDESHLLWISALTDCRPIYGDGKLCGDLRTEIVRIVSERRHFLPMLAREALEPGLPVRHFPSPRLKGFKADEGMALNLKLHGTHLVTHAARLFCLDGGWLEQTGTGERLAWLLEHDPKLHDTAREAMVAYGLFADLRLSWHVDQTSRGEELSDVMPLVKVGETRKRLLMGAYQTVEEIRQRIRTQFSTRS